jgi:integrase/recombinase XerD
MEITMLKQLFPKCHTRYTESSASLWLQSFAEWLVAEGYAYHPSRGHVRRLKQALERASCPTSIDSSFTPDELAVLFACPGEPVILKATERAFRRFLRAEGRLLEGAC